MSVPPSGGIQGNKKTAMQAVLHGTLSLAVRQCWARSCQILEVQLKLVQFYCSVLDTFQTIKTALLNSSSAYKCSDIFHRFFFVLSKQITPIDIYCPVDAQYTTGLCSLSQIYNITCTIILLFGEYTSLLRK